MLKQNGRDRYSYFKVFILFLLNRDLTAIEKKPQFLHYLEKLSELIFSSQSTQIYELGIDELETFFAHLIIQALKSQNCEMSKIIELIQTFIHKKFKHQTPEDYFEETIIATVDKIFKFEPHQNQKNMVEKLFNSLGYNPEIEGSIRKKIKQNKPDLLNILP